MARIAVSAKMRTSNLNGTPAVSTAGAVADMVGSTPYATVDTSLGTLVADGATPTQAHVTAHNTNWTALKAVLNPTIQDVVLSFDNAVITTHTQLRQAVMALLDNLRGSSTLTP